MNYRTPLLFLAAALAGPTNAQPKAEARLHTEASITIHLNARPTEAFPLFGPVRESEWSPHWHPQILYPADKRQEAGAVFTVGESVWILTTYDPAALRVSYAVTTPGHDVRQIEITLKPLSGSGTEATVTYRWTSLATAHDRDVEESARHFPLQREHWEQSINARLKELAK
jgi:hypothetical protein